MGPVSRSADFGEDYPVELVDHPQRRHSDDAGHGVSAESRITGGTHSRTGIVLPV